MSFPSALEYDVVPCTFYALFMTSRGCYDIFSTSQFDNHNCRFAIEGRAEVRERPYCFNTRKDCLQQLVLMLENQINTIEHRLKEIRSLIK